MSPEGDGAPPRVVLARDRGRRPAQLRASLESLASKLGIQERVTWRGFVSAPEKDDFFDSIDVLVMPSDFESFGIVGAEAMMRGVPAVVSPNMGAAQLIRGNGGGLVVPPTAQTVAEALSKLDGDPEMMEKESVQAIEAANARLSFSHIGSRLREQYLDLVWRQLEGFRANPMSTSRPACVGRNAAIL